MLASAGTYIKEFVHGDLGRTIPNVGQLLTIRNGKGVYQFDILQLDVLEVYDSIDEVMVEGDPADIFRVSLL